MMAENDVVDCVRDGGALVGARDLRIYFAPLEGITGYIFRTTYEKYYGGIDKYFSPFVVTRDGGIMKNKELRDILPENNSGIALVPQILTNQAENFIQAASQMKDLGYEEVNLNLGCPSGTVVSKGRGAGFLANLLPLGRFLDEIFEKSPCQISIKTRIGVEDMEEFPEILKLYNQYPVKELIIHPRTRREFYRGTPHRDAFLYACRHSVNPLCYNGDVISVNELKMFCDRKTLRRGRAESFSEEPAMESCSQESSQETSICGSVMIGRGFLARPGFCGNACRKADDGDKAVLKAFVGELLDRYREVMSGDIHALHKMKELWIYLAPHFTNYEKYLKRIKKTNKMGDYLGTVERIFEEETLKTDCELQLI